MSESISLEETNRLRIAAGLKPIPVPGQPSADGVADGEIEEDPDRVAERNYRERVEKERKGREEK